MKSNFLTSKKALEEAIVCLGMLILELPINMYCIRKGKWYNEPYDLSPATLLMKQLAKQVMVNLAQKINWETH